MQRGFVCSSVIKSNKLLIKICWAAHLCPQCSRLLSAVQQKVVRSAIDFFLPYGRFFSPVQKKTESYQHINPPPVYTRLFESKLIYSRFILLISRLLLLLHRSQGEICGLQESILHDVGFLNFAKILSKDKSN